jgi:hypothetical protein
LAPCSHIATYGLRKDGFVGLRQATASTAAVVTTAPMVWAAGADLRLNFASPGSVRVAVLDQTKSGVPIVGFATALRTGGVDVAVFRDGRMAKLAGRTLALQLTLSGGAVAYSIRGDFALQKPPALKTDDDDAPKTGLNDSDAVALFHRMDALLAKNNWTILNDSDIGTQWPKDGVVAPCLAPGDDCHSTLELCAQRCANTTGCAAVSWNGPKSHFGKKGFIGCNFKCNSASGGVWKGAVPGEGLAILIADVNICEAVSPAPSPAPTPPSPTPSPTPPAPPPAPRPPLGPPPKRRVRWYTNMCCDRLWTHDIAKGGALDPVAAKANGPIATGVYTSGWPPAFMYHRNSTHSHLSTIEMGSLGPPTGNSSSLPGNGQGCDNSSNAQNCWSYDLKYMQNYTATVHGLGLDVFAGIDQIDYDYFPGAPNVTVEIVKKVAKSLGAMVKNAGFDGAISDFEPAWVPDKQGYLRWIKVMVSEFSAVGLKFSANVGADFDGGTDYADFAASGVATMAMMDPTYNGINASLKDDKDAVTELVSAEYKRGQASCGVGANLHKGLSGDCSYFWNPTKWSEWIDWVDSSSGLGEISVFPAGMSNHSTSGINPYYTEGLRRFLKSHAPPPPPLKTDGVATSKSKAMDDGDASKGSTSPFR